MTASKFNGYTSGDPISIPAEYAHYQIFQSSGHRLLVSAGGQLLGRVWCNKDRAMWQLISTNTYGTNDPETKRCHRGTVINTSSQLWDSIVPIYLLSDTPLIKYNLCSDPNIQETETLVVMLSNWVVLSPSYANVAMEVIKFYLRSYTVFQTSFI